ncbi:plasma membrane calcium [Polyrhizophydium stewartii]|uniref:Calcium-transporting ATPase n=1 Tax=Polyrhizophydium stewartii TaxID=2732419 RepID=A0ABR4N2C2_9FUNG
MAQPGLVAVVAEATHGAAGATADSASPFALDPNVLLELVDPKNPDLLARLNGVEGLASMLKTDTKRGLAVPTTQTEAVGQARLVLPVATPSSAQRGNGASTVASSERVPTRRDVEHLPAAADTENCLLGETKSSLYPVSDQKLPGKHIKGGNSIRGKLMGMSVLGVNTQNSSESDLVARRRVFGSNALPEPIEKSILQLMWEALQDRTLLVLIGAAIVEMAIGVYESRFAPEGKRDSLALVDGVAIIVAIFIVALVGSISDLQKQSQFRTLNEFGKRLSEVKVIRNGVTQAISSASIVVGDVCLIQTGDVVPADGVLIHGFNVEADESTLTGEPFAVEKDLVRDPFLLSGTNVINGVGRILVIATGVNSLNGRSLLALEVEPEETPLQEKLGRIADFIAKFAIVAAIVATVILVIAYFAINSGSLKTPYAVTEDILSLFILAVTVVVVAVPEGLPLAVTLSLAHATLQMLKDNNLVRHLSSCETMGNATTICSDKTGTLTMNKMTVVKGLIMDTPIDAKTTQAELLSRLGGNGPAGNTLVGKVLSLVMLSVNTNSSADETADKTGKIVFMGSKTEIAILNLTARLGYPYKLDRERVSILQVEPFSSDRKRMSTLASARREAALEGVFTQKDVESVETEHEKWVFVKGASEIVLASCTHYISAHGTVEALAPTKRAHFERIIAEFASGALRTICAAVRHVPSSSEASATGPLEPHHHLDDDKDLVLVAIFGILDPVRPEVPEAVQACQKAGIVVRMVTGDNVATARAIAAECGILSSDGLVMEGPAFRALSEEQMDVVLPRLQVLARSSPLDKQVLVSNLKRLGETVAVTGDGTNDAPALTAADVGFSMGVAGTEVAKEASDIVLMDDNFASLVKAVLWGRCVYDSIRKFLQFQLTVNASAVFITFISAFVTTVGPKHSPYPALSAVQLLWINLIMDTLAALALATDPPSPELLDRKPASRTESILSRDMVMQILGQGIFQIVAIMVIYCNGFAWWATSLPPEEQSSEAGVDSVTATIIFNTFVFCQVFNEINSRSITKDIDVFKNFSKNRMFIGVLVSTVLSQIIIVQFAGIAFKTRASGLGAGGWAISILVGALSLPIGCLIRLMPEFELPWWLERWQGFERLSNTGSEHVLSPIPARGLSSDAPDVATCDQSDRLAGRASATNKDKWLAAIRSTRMQLRVVKVFRAPLTDQSHTAAAETGEGRHMWQTLRSVMNASHAFTSGVRLSRVDYATLQMVDPTRPSVSHDHHDPASRDATLAQELRGCVPQDFGSRSLYCGDGRHLSGTLQELASSPSPPCDFAFPSDEDFLLELSPLQRIDHGGPIFYLDEPRNVQFQSLSAPCDEFAPTPRRKASSGVVDLCRSRPTSDPSLSKQSVGIRLQETLIPKARLPAHIRSFFPFSHFNPVQSACFTLTYESDSNAVISGSGKTVLMELAILRLLSRSGGDQSKIVYIAPTKALCSERARDWQSKFAPYGVSCQEMTGDTDYNRMAEIQRSNIIVTTPEKWDATTRKWRDQKNLLRLLRLVLLDEVHMLKEPGRGATLEAVVSRMKAVSRELCLASEQRSIRFLAISATMPNIADVAEWLRDNRDVPAELRVFGDEYRPVRLIREVIGYPNTSKLSAFAFEHSLDFRLAEVIRRYSSAKPTLIFCSTRKSTIAAADRLYEDFQLLARGGSHPFEWCRRQLAADAMPVFSDKKLAQFVAQGVAFHHGGLSLEDRRAVEAMFLSGKIAVICTTSTLAIGVNLPAHLVIIKGTSQYVNGEFRSYSDMDIEQMLGRAGRPQFDDTGVSVIMTTAERREYYLDVVSGRETIESSLHQNLIEHLNAEVVLGSIENKATALEWLNSTFLYVRIRKNPAYYKLKDCSKEASKLSAEHRLEAMFIEDLQKLHNHGFVQTDQDQSIIKPTGMTLFGSAMAKYYLMFKTVLAVVKLKSRPSLPEVAEEFERIRFHSDKAHLNALNKNQDIRFPIKGRVVTISQKVNVLLQLARALANSGILSFDDLIKAGPQRVEMLANRHPPFGTKLVTAAQSQPRLVMNVSQIQTVGSVAASRDALTLDLSVSVGVSNPLSGQFLDFRRLP